MVTFAVTPEQIREAADRLIATRPAYRDIIDFYARLFSAQEASRSDIRIAPITIDAAERERRQQEGMPLIAPSEFVLDMSAAGALFGTICDMAKDANPAVAEAAAALSAAVDQQRVSLEELLPGILDSDSRRLGELADRLEMAFDALQLFVYGAVLPSVRTGAEQLATYLNEDVPWDQGYCPLCGSPPGMAMLLEEGRERVSCSFCWHTWPSSRSRCAFCGHTDRQARQYFFNEEEKEYRVYTCDECRGYIKTVDTRELDRPVYLPLEQVASLHLDVQAQEQGFQPGIADIRPAL